MVQLSFPLQALPFDVLPKESLPLLFEAVTPAGSIYGYELETLRRLVLELEKKPDGLLMTLLEHFYPQMIFEIPIIATSGNPQAKTVWTSTLKGKTSIFFNLSGWRVDTLTRVGARALLQEAVLALFAPLLKKKDGDSALAEMEMMILSHGLSHFLAAGSQRSQWLSEKSDEGPASEEKINKTKLSLIHPDTDVQDASEILEDGVTGDFWQRYIAVAGMFRLDQVFQQSGAQGLIRCIEERQIRSAESLQIGPKS
jgi:hypothetical protein